MTINDLLCNQKMVQELLYMIDRKVQFVGQDERQNDGINIKGDEYGTGSLKEKIEVNMWYDLPLDLSAIANLDEKCIIIPVSICYKDTEAGDKRFYAGDSGDFKVYFNEDGDIIQYKCPAMSKDCLEDLNRRCRFNIFKMFKLYDII